MEEEIKILHTDIQQQKINQAKNEEQIKTVFNVINEIKDNIKEILTEIRGIKEQPAQDYKNIKMQFIKGTISVLVGGVVGFLLKGAF